MEDDENFSKIESSNFTVEVPANEQYWRSIPGTNPVGYYRDISIPSNLQNKNIISVVINRNYSDDDYIVVGPITNKSIILINFNANTYTKRITLKITYYR